MVSLQTPHFHLKSVSSTLTEAWSILDGGQGAPFWLTADEQTHGRGRLDRQWVSMPGNLYSTLLTPAPARHELSLVPFAVSLAVYHTLYEHLPETRRSKIATKWPNDVLIDGAKTSGILIEQRVSGANGHLLAIGIGVNVDHAPDLGAARTTTSLSAEGSFTKPGEVFESLRRALAQSLQHLETTPQSIVPAWSQHAIGLGGPIAVISGSTTLEGTFDHLASDGALMIRLASGVLRAVRTGDVVIKAQHA